MVRKERDYQGELIKRIESRFPGCLVLKNDEQYIQGIPDLTILYGMHWFALEVKRDRNAPQGPNQHYYLCRMNDMSYAAYIYPEIEEAVLDEIQRAFGS